MEIIGSAGRQRVNRAWEERLGSRGLLVVGHGTADPVGAEETRAVTRLAASLLPGVPVELGFLEVIGPSIDDACRTLATRGCQVAVAAPLLLFTAGHARRDVPEALVDAARRHGIRVVLSAAFGCHPLIVELSQRRRQATLSSLEPLPPRDTVLVMVGRGSSAPDAVAQLREFAACTQSNDDGGMAIELGFVAAARPTLDEAFALAVARQPRRIIVQPHLLFRGHVEEQVTAAVERHRGLHPEIDWVMVPRLGADRLVAEALVEQATGALDEAEMAAQGPFSAGKNVSQEPA